MGKGGGESSTTTSTSIPEWLTPYYEQIASEAKKQYGQKYPTYDINQRLAPLSEDTLGAMSFLRDTAYQQLPAYDQGLSILSDVAGRSGLDAYSQYANPYLEDVLGASRKSLQNQAAREKAALDASLAGSFGGSRQAVAQDLLTQTYADKLNELETSQRAAAYDSAWGKFLADQQNQMQGAAALMSGAQAAQQGFLAAGSQQAAVGQSLDERSQYLDDLQYEDFMNQANWDRSKLQEYASLVYPLGDTFKTTTQSTKQGGSGLGGVLGTALSIGSMFVPGGAFAGLFGGTAGGIVNGSGVVTQGALKGAQYIF